MKSTYEIINAIDNEGYTQLTRAIKEFDLEGVKELLANGADLNAASYNASPIYILNKLKISLDNAKEYDKEKFVPQNAIIYEEMRGIIEACAAEREAMIQDIHKIINDSKKSDIDSLRCMLEQFQAKKIMYLIEGIPIPNKFNKYSSMLSMLDFAFRARRVDYLSLMIKMGIKYLPDGLWDNALAQLNSSLSVLKNRLLDKGLSFAVINKVKDLQDQGIDINFDELEKIVSELAATSKFNATLLDCFANVRLELELVMLIGGLKGSIDPLEGKEFKDNIRDLLNALLEETVRFISDNSWSDFIGLSGCPAILTNRVFLEQILDAKDKGKQELVDKYNNENKNIIINDDSLILDFKKSIDFIKRYTAFLKKNKSDKVRIKEVLNKYSDDEMRYNLLFVLSLTNNFEKEIIELFDKDKINKDLFVLDKHGKLDSCFTIALDNEPNADEILDQIELLLNIGLVHIGGFDNILCKVISLKPSLDHFKKIVELLLKREPELFKNNENKLCYRNFLVSAVKAGSLEIVNFLLDQGLKATLIYLDREPTLSNTSDKSIVNYASCLNSEKAIIKRLKQAFKEEKETQEQAKDLVNPGLQPSVKTQQSVPQVQQKQAEQAKELKSAQRIQQQSPAIQLEQTRQVPQKFTNTNKNLKLADSQNKIDEFTFPNINAFISHYLTDVVKIYGNNIDQMKKYFDQYLEDEIIYNTLFFLCLGERSTEELIKLFDIRKISQNCYIINRAGELNSKFEYVVNYTLDGGEIIEADAIIVEADKMISKIEYLLNLGSKPNHPTLNILVDKVVYNGLPLKHFKKAVELLLEKHPRFFEGLKDYENPLIKAVFRGNLEIVNFLLDKGIEVAFINMDYSTRSYLDYLNSGKGGKVSNEIIERLEQAYEKEKKSLTADKVDLSKYPWLKQSVAVQLEAKESPEEEASRKTEADKQEADRVEAQRKAKEEAERLEAQRQTALQGTKPSEELITNIEKAIDNLTKKDLVEIILDIINRDVSAGRVDKGNIDAIKLSIEQAYKRVKNNKEEATYFIKENFQEGFSTKLTEQEVEEALKKENFLRIKKFFLESLEKNKLDLFREIEERLQQNARVDNIDANDGLNNQQPKSSEQSVQPHAQVDNNLNTKAPQPEQVIKYEDVKDNLRNLVTNKDYEGIAKFLESFDKESISRFYFHLDYGEVDVRIVDMLIEIGSRKNFNKDFCLYHGLHKAVDKINNPVVGRLIEHGAKADAVTGREEGILKKVVRGVVTNPKGPEEGEIDLIRLLISKGAKVNKKEGADNVTVLEYAISKNLPEDSEILKILREASEKETAAEAGLGQQPQPSGPANLNSNGTAPRILFPQHPHAQPRQVGQAARGQTARGMAIPSLHPTTHPVPVSVPHVTIEKTEAKKSVYYPKFNYKKLSKLKDSNSYSNILTSSYNISSSIATAGIISFGSYIKDMLPERISSVWGAVSNSIPKVKNIETIASRVIEYLGVSAKTANALKVNFILALPFTIMIAAGKAVSNFMRARNSGAGVGQTVGETLYDMGTLAVQTAAGVVGTAIATASIGGVAAPLVASIGAVYAVSELARHAKPVAGKFTSKIASEVSSKLGYSK